MALCGRLFMCNKIQHPQLYAVLPVSKQASAISTVEFTTQQQLTHMGEFPSFTADFQLIALQETY